MTSIANIFKSEKPVRMAFIGISVMAAGLFAASFLTSSSENKGRCHCKDCHCTPENNCGCMSGGGCHCSPGCKSCGCCKS